MDKGAIFDYTFDALAILRTYTKEPFKIACKGHAISHIKAKILQLFPRPLTPLHFQCSIDSTLFTKQPPS